MTEPQRIEPCLSGRCYSPIACGGWGYCRQRNDGDRRGPTYAQIAERQAIAAARIDHITAPPGAGEE